MSSPKTASYRDKIRQLQGELKKAEAAVGGEKCLSTSVIVAAVAPVLIFLVLFFLTPSFVQRKEGNKYVRCLGKVFMWTVIFSVVVWGGMYLFTYCDGWIGSSICTRT